MKKMSMLLLCACLGSCTVKDPRPKRCIVVMHTISTSRHGWVWYNTLLKCQGGNVSTCNEDYYTVPVGDTVNY